MTDLDSRPTPPPPSPRVVSDEKEASGTNPARLAILGGLIALLAVRGGWAPLLVVAGVVVMIFLHELGHYLAARWGGMKVTEFFIGFGPKIWSFQRGETEYGLKVIPAGAYVKVIGMNNLDEVDEADEDKTYRQASYPRRMAVAVAGSAMHFAQAIVILFLLYAFIGLPGGSLTEDREWEIGEVMAGSAADAADLQPGDRIQTIDGRDVETFTSFRNRVADKPGQLVLLTVERDGVVSDVSVRLGDSGGLEPVGLLGIRRDLVTTTVSVPQAATSAVGDFVDQSRATLGFLGSFFSPSGIADFAGDVASGQDDSRIIEGTGTGGTGPAVESQDDGRIISILGAVRIGSDLTETGLLGFLVFFIGINITIGIFNLLPVLPLDGGHVVIATYERIREITRPKGERYHVDMLRLLPLVYAVFVVLIVLGVTTIYLDLIDPVTL